MQAGPLLVAGGAIAFDLEADEEGFSAGSARFGSDITLDRHQRAAHGPSGQALVVEPAPV